MQILISKFRGVTYCRRRVETTCDGCAFLNGVKQELLRERRFLGRLDIVFRVHLLFHLHAVGSSGSPPRLASEWGAGAGRAPTAGAGAERRRAGSERRRGRTVRRRLSLVSL